MAGDVGKGRADAKRPGWLQGKQGAEPEKVLREDVKGCKAMVRRLPLVLWLGERFSVFHFVPVFRVL